ncbi:C-terminal binding protein [Chloroflexota bacterium]
MMEKGFKVVRVDKEGAASDPMEEERAELAKVGAELVAFDCATEDDIIEAARDADALITVKSPITRRILEALPKCKVIVRYGVGFDTVDVDAATDNGILVVNLPDFCLEEVSNHAITMLLACAKKLVFLNNKTKEGQWLKPKQGRWEKGSLGGVGPICGQTLGIIGCGNIGRITARKAQCFGLKILGYDPYLDKSVAERDGITLVNLPELLKESDYISIHTPLNKDTRHLIGEKELKQMRPTAYLINTSRGPVVDEAALIKALQEKWIAGAGLDVFEKEPVDPDNPLLQMDNVIVTAHSGGYSDAAFIRQGTSVAQEAARVISGRWPKNAVNKAVKPKVNLAKGD